MDNRDIIEYNVIKDKLVLNRDAIFMTTELKALYRNRKRNPKSITAVKENEVDPFEFKMLWWIYNPASPGFKSGLELKDLIEEAKDKFAPIDWKTSLIFNTAAKAYSEVMIKGNAFY